MGKSQMASIFYWYHFQLIIVIVIVIVIVIKRIAIMRIGMGMGTIVGGYKSFRRQKTRDSTPPLPSTPPLLVLYFYHMLLSGYRGIIC